MKRQLLIAFALLFFSITLVSAESKAWFTFETEAKAYALEHKVPVMYVFAGSDWCKPCIQLKETILKSEPFQVWHPEKIAVLYLDFPQQKKNQLPDALRKQNEKLAAEYNKTGYFPYVVVLTPEGKVLGNLAFKHQTPEEFIRQCEALLSAGKAQ